MDEFESKPSQDLVDSLEPLLDDENPISSRRGRSWISRFWGVVLSAACAVYVVISVPLLIILLRNRVPQPYSPVNHLLSYERQPLYFGEDSKYTGLPQEVDKAWDYLLEPINIRTTKKELEQSLADFGDDIVQVTDGDYVAVLSVHHELHCLNALRMNIFHDYYYSNATEEDKEYNIIHMTHCVDTIRRSLMCKADVAVYTAYWIGDHTAYPSKELRSNSDTVCVNWEAIDTWSRERLLPKDKYKVRPGPYEKLDV